MSFLDPWQKMSTPARLGGLDLQSVTYGNLTYVAVGSGGRLARSHDGGQSWNDDTIGAEIDLLGMTFACGQFVAVGQAGNILVSAHGEQWEKEPSGVRTNLNAITFGRGLLVAVGDQGTIVIRPEGEGWLRRRSPTTANLYGVAYGQDRFVAVGEDGTILESTDGWSWRQIAAGVAPHLYGVAHGQGTFVAVGAEGIILTYREADGIARRNSGTARDLRGVTYGRGGFVVASSLLGSSDGKEWLMLPRQSGALLRAVNYGNGRYTAVGNNGLIIQSPPVSPSANLVLTERGVQQGEVGKPFTYDLTISNKGPAADPDVHLQSTLAGATYLSATASQGECEVGEQSLHCHLGSLKPGETAVVTVTIQSDGVGSATTRAAVIGTLHDPNVTDNRLDNQMVIALPPRRQALLTIKQASCPPRAKVGDVLIYRLVINNKGPVTARQTVVTERLPAGTILMEATGSQGTVAKPKAGQPGVVTWRLGDLGPNREAVVLLKLRATAQVKNPVANSFMVKGSNAGQRSVTLTTRITAS